MSVAHESSRTEGRVTRLSSIPILRQSGDTLLRALCLNKMQFEGNAVRLQVPRQKLPAFCRASNNLAEDSTREHLFPPMKGSALTLLITGAQ
jgi:hypothetical protein